MSRPSAPLCCSVFVIFFTWTVAVSVFLVTVKYCAHGCRVLLLCDQVVTSSDHILHLLTYFTALLLVSAKFCALLVSFRSSHCNMCYSTVSRVTCTCGGTGEGVSVYVWPAYAISSSVSTIWLFGQVVVFPCLLVCTEYAKTADWSAVLTVWNRMPRRCHLWSWAWPFQLHRHVDRLSAYSRNIRKTSDAHRFGCQVLTKLHFWYYEFC